MVVHFLMKKAILFDKSFNLNLSNASLGVEKIKSSLRELSEDFLQALYTKAKNCLNFSP